MAKLTWLGEDEDGTAGPSFTICFEMKFPKGEAVEVRYYSLVQTALGNRFFEVDDADDVDDAPGKPRKVGRPSNADKAAAAEAEAAKVQAPSSDLSEPTKISEK